MFDNDIFNRNMVCHYTGKKAAISILSEKKINFSRLSSCDDPRESKQWSFDFIGSEQRLCLEQYSKVPNIFSSFIRDNSRVLCFCGWNDEEIDFSNNMVAPYREAYYRTGFARSRMWSQYGRDRTEGEDGRGHTGICLVFDRNLLVEQFETSFKTNKIFYENVEYQYYLESFVKARKIDCRNILNHSIDEALKKQIDTHYHEFFFLKSMDYRDEHEYRLIVIVDNDDSISLPITSSLKEVIVGVDFPPEEFETIDELTLSCSSSAERWFLSWQEGRPQLFNL